MKKIFFYSIIVIVSLILLFFLFPSDSEEEVELGDGYSYIPYQETTFDVTMFAGNGIYYLKDSLYRPVVFPNIIKYNKDSLYIIIEQEFDFDETKILLSNMIFSPNLYFGYDEEFVPLDRKYTIFSKSNYLNTEYTAKIMQEDSRISKMIKNKLNYYIIDKKSKRTIGPLTLREFESIKNEMGIALEFED